MALLDANIIEQLKSYFDKIEDPIEIVGFLNDSEKSKELDGFLNEVNSISDKVNYVKTTFGEDKALEEKLGITRPTSFSLVINSEKTGINFYGIPGGHEFNSFVLAILGLAGLGKKLERDQAEKVLSVQKPLDIEVFISLSCTHCPEVVQALNLISITNKNINVSMVDSAVYFNEAKEKDIQAVPVVFINGKQASVGAQTLEQLISLVINA